jgi:hypothetical protein
MCLSYDPEEREIGGEREGNDRRGERRERVCVEITYFKNRRCFSMNIQHYLIHRQIQVNEHADDRCVID